MLLNVLKTTLVWYFPQIAITELCWQSCWIIHGQATTRIAVHLKRSIKAVNGLFSAELCKSVLTLECFQWKSYYRKDSLDKPSLGFAQMSQKISQLLGLFVGMEEALTFIVDFLWFSLSPFFIRQRLFPTEQATLPSLSEPLSFYRDGLWRA